MTMKCFVLGSGGMMPMPTRRLTSVGLRLEGSVYLLDCGEGTQIPYKELHLGQRALALVAITHLHADHVLGLPGMLMLRAQMPDPGPLIVLGPPGLTRFIDNVRHDLAIYINYEIKVREWQRGANPEAFRDEQLRVIWAPLDHTVLCLGYRVEEHDRPGRFDAARAEALKVPRGPLWGALQQGRTVETPTGARVEPAQVLGPPRRGRHVAFITDTAPAPSMERLLWQADLAFVEGMFLAEHAEEARSKKHLTVHQATQAASAAGAEELVLVHLSPRYLETGHIERFEEEAREAHPRARVARDGEVITVPSTDLPPRVDTLSGEGGAE